MRGRLLLCAFAVAAVMLVPTGAASAGTPGNWTQFTTSNLHNFAEPGLARTADGVFHVVWHRPVSASSDDLMHTAISRTGGVVGGPVTIESGWQGLNAQPDLVAAPGGTSLRVFFAGTHTLTLDDTLNYQLLTATAGPDGSSWSAPQRVTSSSHPSYASAGIGAAMAPNGTPVVAAGDPGNIFHFGIGGPDFVYESRAGMNVYDPGVGVDSTSRQAVLAWFSLGDASEGTYARAITPSGPSGSTVFLPGSASADRRSANPPLQRTAITGRLGDSGVYIAYGVGYPSRTSVALARFGGGSLTVGRGTSIDNVAIAPAPEGRLWVTWSDGPKIYAVRTNKAATRVGPRVGINRPPGSVSLFGVFGEGSLGTLDLIANSGTASNAVAMWHTEVLPPLELRARGGRGSVTATVTDAGDPVAGAAVAAGGRRGTTNGQGVATLKVARTGRVTVKATKGGYRAASAGARVLRPKKKKR